MGWPNYLAKAGIVLDGSTLRSSRTFLAPNLTGTRGKILYVDSSVTASGNGKSWARAYKTITEAVAAASANDVIMLVGTFTEAVTVATAGLTFIGAGSTANGNIWMESAAGDTLVTLNAARCQFHNIRFRIPTTGGTGIALGAAGYTIIEDCRFQGRLNSYYAISNVGTADDCKILNCEFLYNNTATYGTAIYGSTYAADITGSGWVIAGNLFHSNLRHVYTRLRQAYIHDNTFVENGLGPAGAVLAATTKLNLSGAQSNWNVVTKNVMLGDYSNTGGYTAGTEDNWAGNFSDDIAEAEVTDFGTTSTVPAA
jgi:hypothetical protein